MESKKEIESREFKSREIKPMEMQVRPETCFTPVMSNDIPFQDVNGSIELLDSILQARTELFEKQFSDNMKAHKKFAGMLMK